MNMIRLYRVTRTPLDPGVCGAVTAFIAVVVDNSGREMFSSAERPSPKAALDDLLTHRRYLEAMESNEPEDTALSPGEIASAYDRAKEPA